MAHDVFISHANADKTVADMVCATLEQQGIRCWIAPRDIQAGADWGEAIVSAIRGCRVMVLVFSDHANKSVHVAKELERALDSGVLIIPFRIQDVAPRGSLEYSLAGVHWLDAITPPVETHLRQLADTIAKIIDVPRPPPPLPLPSVHRLGMFGVAGIALVAIVTLALLLRTNLRLTSATAAASASPCATGADDVDLHTHLIVDKWADVANRFPGYESQSQRVCTAEAKPGHDCEDYVCAYATTAVGHAPSYFAVRLFTGVLGVSSTVALHVRAPNGMKIGDVMYDKALRLVNRDEATWLSRTEFTFGPSGRWPWLQSVFVYFTVAARPAAAGQPLPAQAAPCVEVRDESRSGAPTASKCAETYDIHW
jgi:hypothetical protein